mgnify:FL=1
MLMSSRIMEYKKRIMVTGGAGFIGNEVVRHFVKKYPEYLIVNFDCLTYAGNLENLKEIQANGNYRFFRGDIRSRRDINSAFESNGITDIIHLAAESHVDRSITGPKDFVETNVLGTFNLLEAARDFWKDDYSAHRFHHVSTDEVYGSLELGNNERFHETTKYDPHSPYSASKASSDHFVKAYHDTYGMNVTISNCSNNYGPYQFPEKLIPLAINNLKNGRKIPIYGKGDNVRDWLYVGDHAKAIDVIFHDGKNGETYNVGGLCERSNYELIVELLFAYLKIAEGFEGDIVNLLDYVEFVEDRKGHDKRYSIDCSKLMHTLGWKPEVNFRQGLENTVKWYLENEEWLNGVTSGEYKKYYEKQYGKETLQKQN